MNHTAQASSKASFDTQQLIKQLEQDQSKSFELASIPGIEGQMVSLHFGFSHVLSFYRNFSHLE